MSHHRPPTDDELNKLIRKVSTAISTGSDVLSVVEDLLRQAQARSIVKDTTSTAYRRVHEVVTAILDFIAAVPRIVQTQGKTTNEEVIRRAEQELARAKIIIRYQRARGQISDSIERLLETVLDRVSDHIRRRDLAQAAQAAERGRLILDSLAVLVYMPKR